MKLDHTQLVIEDLHGHAEFSDRAYWEIRTPIERLHAMQIDRQVAYGRTSASRRLQRVLEVVDRG